MLARLAENLFWAGRYLVRAEDSARMVDVTWHMLLESPSTETSRAWEDLLEVLQQGEGFEQWAGGDDDLMAVRPDDVVRWLVSERSNGGSVLASVGMARENARSVRELLSSEVWEAVNDLHLTLHRRDLPHELGDQPYDLFRTVKLHCQTVMGVALETMPRDEAFRFLLLGRALERAEMTCRLVSVRWEDLLADRAFQLAPTLLRSVGSLEAFRKRHRASANPIDVLQLLVLDRDLPRSVLFQLEAAGAQLARVGRAGRGPEGPSARRLGRAHAALRYRDAAELVELGVEDVLERMQVEVREVTEAIGEEFFTHAPTGALHAVGAVGGEGAS